MPEALCAVLCSFGPTASASMGSFVRTHPGKTRLRAQAWSLIAIQGGPWEFSFGGSGLRQVCCGCHSRVWGANVERAEEGRPEAQHTEFLFAIFSEPQNALLKEMNREIYDRSRHCQGPALGAFSQGTKLREGAFRKNYFPRFLSQLAFSFRYQNLHWDSSSS